MSIMPFPCDLQVAFPKPFFFDWCVSSSVFSLKHFDLCTPKHIFYLIFFFLKKIKTSSLGISACSG